VKFWQVGGGSKVSGLYNCKKKTERLPIIKLFSDRIWNQTSQKVPKICILGLFFNTKDAEREFDECNDLTVRSM
jgi:hypothetical protein